MPSGPIIVSDVFTDKCTIAWQPPLLDGGSSVNNYSVERRETSRIKY